jgi:hypothetical protein
LAIAGQGILAPAEKKIGNTISNGEQKSKLFEKFSTWVSGAVGSTAAFMMAFAVLAAKRLSAHMKKRWNEKMLSVAS